ncbi:hypothetical protein SPSIL_038630 [Sporomusa silvacetica DSM 10669]|uniref:TonB C-terminal domain-containing protein n=1 Tax=Sporomusa silvacetica DSM 10669 TaxID=1123289 RepID=A0ABZ3IPK8_9FIRM|nr:energy transducer TonB [Sporomusa silvacetica]OZC23446.1 gram-negative bacterial tonB protein [Sporomusa silvacetica DSM 10669]
MLPAKKKWLQLFGVLMIAIIILPQYVMAAPAVVRVSEEKMAANLIYQPKPIYPNIAKINHVQGKVIMLALISTTGEVEELRLISGHQLLAPLAMEAVKKWKYKPYLIEEKPVKVNTTVTVAFTLPQ